MTQSSLSPRFAEQNLFAPQGDDCVVRRGRVSWLTHPPSGTARIESESHAFGTLPVTFPEADPVPKEATPGELLAIAHALFVAAALSEEFAQAGTPANELVVEASCTFSGTFPDRELVALGLEVSGRVPGLDATSFAQAAAVAQRRALRAASVRDELERTLQSTLERS